MEWAYSSSYLLRPMKNRNPLEEIIKGKIEAEGPITFRDYMDLCLYHPEHGFYTSGRIKIKDGDGGMADFVTNPIQYSPAFGVALASIIAQLAESNGGGVRRIISLGPGTGILDKDLLDGLQAFAPDVYKKVEYTIVEISPALIKKQKEKLVRHTSKIDYRCESVIDFRFHTLRNTVVFSNELFDMFPVHIIKKTARGLKESYVKVENGQFVYSLGKCSSDGVKDYVGLGQAIKRIYVTGEKIVAQVDAIQFMRNVSAALESGVVISFDYGTFYEKQGRAMVRTFSSDPHRMHDGPLKDPGEKDITSDVDFGIIAAASTELKVVHVGGDLLSLHEGCRAEDIERYKTSEHLRNALYTAAIKDKRKPYLMLIQQKGDFIIPSDLHDRLRRAQECYQRGIKFGDRLAVHAHLPR